MYAKLIAKSEPVIDIPADGLVAYVARVSNPDNQMNFATGPKLLKYLVENKHWSPFEMVHATMEIETTRDIARQILRHRSFSFQEFSQRYAVAEDTTVEREARLQDKANRQNSISTSDVELHEYWRMAQYQVAQAARNVYEDALRRGIAKEVARAVLPEGLTVTRLYMAGSLRSWVHYIQLRTEAGTQKEHRQVAQACLEELRKAFPELPI